jgi:hypothetical protein
VYLKSDSIPNSDQSYGIWTVVLMINAKVNLFSNSLCCSEIVWFSSLGIDSTDVKLNLLCLYSVIFKPLLVFCETVWKQRHLPFRTGLEVEYLKVSRIQMPIDSDNFFMQFRSRNHHYWPFRARYLASL